MLLAWLVNSTTAAVRFLRVETDSVTQKYIKVPKNKATRNKSVFPEVIAGLLGFLFVCLKSPPTSFHLILFYTSQAIIKDALGSIPDKLFNNTATTAMLGMQVL